jgi:hypothetical protein
MEDLPNKSAQPRFVAEGKEVLEAGVHFADARDEAGAKQIVAALNTGEPQ